MISTMQVKAVVETPKVSAIPRLETGDHLSRAEFERRYAAMPDVKSAELIEGMVIMPSPVSNAHSKANSLMVWWLVGYAAATPGTEVGDNATVRLEP